MFIRAYLRASTKEQDAERVREELKSFAQSKLQDIASFYLEHISGTKAERPELERLINDASPGDILLIEKIDRLTRLPYQQWQNLKTRILEAGLQIVVLDQPMTHNALTTNDETQNAIQQALTAFMLDLGAAMARDDYETRAKRQAQGIEKAKKNGVYKGRPEDTEKHKVILKLLNNGLTYSQIEKTVKVSRPTIAKVKRLYKNQLVAEKQLSIIE